MKIMFLGVGEACDETLPNTSVWIRTLDHNDRRKSLLLDCGFTVTPLYWQHNRDPNDLDVLWISHFHGDHFFGVPSLLLRFWEMKRSKPFVITGQKGIEDIIHRTMELAYPGFLHKLTYPLQFYEVEPSRKEIRISDLTWRFAENGHGQKDLAVRIEDGKYSVFYSGDGKPTKETLALAKGCDLIIHEAFDLHSSTPGHGTVTKCIEFARNAGAPLLALVHVQRDVRRERRHEILQMLQDVEDIQVLLPEPGDILNV